MIAKILYLIRIKIFIVQIKKLMKSKRFKLKYKNLNKIQFIIILNIYLMYHNKYIR